jgi:hypothetical protein
LPEHRRHDHYSGIRKILERGCGALSFSMTFCLFCLLTARLLVARLSSHRVASSGVRSDEGFHEMLLSVFGRDAKIPPEGLAEMRLI